MSLALVSLMITGTVSAVACFVEMPLPIVLASAAVGGIALVAFLSVTLREARDSGQSLVDDAGGRDVGGTPAQPRMSAPASARSGLG